LANSRFVLSNFSQCNDKTVLESFYHVTIEEQDSYEVLELIGKQSNFLTKKAKVDETRAAVKIINDWQKGLLIFLSDNISS